MTTMSLAGQVNPGPSCSGTRHGSHAPVPYPRHGARARSSPLGYRTSLGTTQAGQLLYLAEANAMLERPWRRFNPFQGSAELDGAGLLSPSSSPNPPRTARNLVPATEKRLRQHEQNNKDPGVRLAVVGACTDSARLNASRLSTHLPSPAAHPLPPSPCVRYESSLIRDALSAPSRAAAARHGSLPLLL